MAVGANLVVDSGVSIAHAQPVALSLAHAAVGSFDLGSGRASHELETSTEPGAMSLGAVCSSGVRYVACGARGEDAEAIGFDEGPKPSRWVRELERRGIAVTRDVRRDRAAEVLRNYRDCGGVSCNARSA